MLLMIASELLIDFYVFSIFSIDFRIVPYVCDCCMVFLYANCSIPGRWTGSHQEDDLISSEFSLFLTMFYHASDKQNGTAPPKGPV